MPTPPKDLLEALTGREEDESAAFSTVRDARGKTLPMTREWDEYLAEHKKFDFQIEQYVLLRREIEERFRHIGTMTIFMVSGIALFYTWILTFDFSHLSFTDNFVNHRYVFLCAWWIPVIFPLIGGLRSAAIILRIHAIGEYNARIEKYFQCSEELIGWENWLAQRRDRSVAANSLFYSSLISWFILLALTVTIAATVRFVLRTV